MKTHSPDSHFFHSPLALGKVTLSEEESKHVVKVSRAKPGDFLTLTDGNGSISRAQIKNANPFACEVEILSLESLPRPHSISLAIACLKDDGNEEIALHASETHVDEIILLRTERSQEPKNSNLDRIRRRMEIKCRVSLKQSLKAWETKILGPYTLQEWLLSAQGTIILCDPLGKDFSELSLSDSKGTLLIGPEGGFSEKEKSLIINAPNAETFLLKLGETRLRARSAALFALGKFL